MEREKKLAKNIVIFAIGSFSSKLLQFLLIPFYTRVLSNSEYGTIDILQNIATLLIPIISLTISEAVFRYAMDKIVIKRSIVYRNNNKYNRYCSNINNFSDNF